MLEFIDKVKLFFCILSFIDKHNGFFMVLITFIYVIATIAIWFANIRAAKAAEKQYEETKREYEEEKQKNEELKRLQIMPYLQFKDDLGKVDSSGQPLTPYTFFVITDAEGKDKLLSVRFFSLVNVGTGMLNLDLSRKVQSGNTQSLELDEI